MSIKCVLGIHPNENSKDALTVLEEGGFDLSSGQTVARDVDNIVDTATDPVVTIVIATSAISGELEKVLSQLMPLP